MCNLGKSSADLVLTSCLDQRNELISSSVIVYVYYVKWVVCEYILYINSLYSNSNVVVFNDILHMSFLAGTHVFKAFPAYITTEI